MREVKGSDTVVEMETHNKAFNENANSYSVNKMCITARNTEIIVMKKDLLDT